MVAPYAFAMTHASQMTKPKMGSETAWRRISIHAPGRGRIRVQAGWRVSAT